MEVLNWVVVGVISRDIWMTMIRKMVLVVIIDIFFVIYYVFYLVNNMSG